MNFFDTHISVCDSAENKNVVKNIFLFTLILRDQDCVRGILKAKAELMIHVIV